MKWRRTETLSVRCQDLHRPTWLLGRINWPSCRSNFGLAHLSGDMLCPTVALTDNTHHSKGLFRPSRWETGTANQRPRNQRKLLVGNTRSMEHKKPRIRNTTCSQIKKFHCSNSDVMCFLYVVQLRLHPKSLRFLFSILRVHSEFLIKKFP